MWINTANPVKCTHVYHGTYTCTYVHVRVPVCQGVVSIAFIKKNYPLHLPILIESKPPVRLLLSDPARPRTHCASGLGLGLVF